MPARPNILLIMTDQQSHRAMSCTGNPNLHTPALDSLAETGVRFSNAYCSYPLCTPSRAATFTGRMPHEVGIDGNNQPINETYREEELGFLFQKAGYDCVYGGKWHLPEISIPDQEHGFRRICPFDDTHLAARCVEYLEEDRQEPFLMVASFDNPHNICEWARNQPLPWGPIEDAPTEACPNLPPNYAIPPFEPGILRRTQSWQPRPYPMWDWGPEQWRHYRQAYFRLVEKVDGEIGLILEGLRANGLQEDTLIVFVSDHGDGMGCHQWSQKSVMYDEVTRVPLLVSFKGVTQAGEVDPHLASTGLDILPTLCDYADIPLPDGLRGRSLRGLAEGEEPTAWREAVFCESVLSRQHKVAARMVRTERYKYSIYSWGRYREQLVDLKNDPGEMTNLAVEEHHQPLLAQHRGLLRDWCLETDDLFDEHYGHPGQPTLPGYGYEE
jgi:arylsulfatase A-like enzyme